MIYINNFLMIWVAREYPLGLKLHFYGIRIWPSHTKNSKGINALSGWCFISTYRQLKKIIIFRRVSMPFRAGAPFLQRKKVDISELRKVYQCPFGLVLHFYDGQRVRRSSSRFSYQCPFGLVLHFYEREVKNGGKNSKKYQCPFGLVLHFYSKSFTKC